MHTYVDRVYQMQIPDKRWQKIERFSQRYSRTRLLVIPTRIAKELLSNLLGAIYTNGLNPLTVINGKQFNKFEGLLKELASPMLNKVSKYSEMIDPKTQTRAEKARDWIVTVSDNLVSKPIFVKEFNRRFRGSYRGKI